MTAVLVRLVQLPAQAVAEAEQIHEIQVTQAVVVVVVALVAAQDLELAVKAILVATQMAEDMVAGVAQVLLVNQQLLLNQIHTVQVALEYFHTWTGLAHFMLVAVVLVQQILVAGLVIQPLVVDQRQELVVVLEQIQHPLETALQEQQIAEAQGEVPRLVMVLIKELAEQAALV
jgi:hypothetical protein